LPEVQRLQEKKFSETKGVPTVHKPLDDDDIIASLDLDIDDI
jgi:RNA polymerase-associated protein RTF1